MAVVPEFLKAAVEAELTNVSDARVIAHIRALLVEPSVVMRRWDYGKDGEEFPCWTVLSDPTCNNGIAFCESGFGPRAPWGLVFLKGDEAATSIGMDCGWFESFLEAFWESFAATDLPIWRVFKAEAGDCEANPITDEGEWESTWAQVMALRKSDHSSRYDCDTTVRRN